MKQCFPFPVDVGVIADVALLRARNDFCEDALDIKLPQSLVLSPEFPLISGKEELHHWKIREMVLFQRFSD